MADEMHAGDAIALTYPSFPAATTVAIPTDCNVSNSVLYCGKVESQFDVNATPPRLRFAAAIL